MNILIDALRQIIKTPAENSRNLILVVYDTNSMFN